MSCQNRRPAGSPAGGQFAAGARDESSMHLTDPPPSGDLDVSPDEPEQTEVVDPVAVLRASIEAAKRRRAAIADLTHRVRAHTGCDPRVDSEFGGVTVEPCAECRTVTAVTTLSQDGERFSRVCADCAGLT